MANETSMMQFPSPTQPPRKSSSQLSGANFTFHISPNGAVGKKSVDSAQKRANHNALERARRESLNNKFQELANAIPSLSLVRRPSKSIIVQKSLDFVERTKTNAELYTTEVEKLQSENMELRQEVNMLRERLGLPLLSPRPQPVPLPPIIDVTQDVDHGSEQTSRKSSISSPPPRDCKTGTCYEAFKSDLEEMISTDEENESEGATITSKASEDNLNQNITFSMDIPQSNSINHCSIENYNGFDFRDASFVPTPNDYTRTLFLQDQSGTPSYANSDLGLDLSSDAISNMGELHSMGQFEELALTSEVNYNGLETNLSLMSSMPQYENDQN